MNKKELHNIFQEMLTGNKEAYAKLYENYQSFIYGIAFSILKQKENSEDVVQQVFIKLWNMDAEKFPTDYEASWLYTVTKHEAINFLRTTQKEVSLEDIYTIQQEATDIEAIIDKETYNAIITQLDTQEQEIVSLKVLAGLSFREIAQILHKPIGTIQWKYYKAVHTLKIFFGNVSMFLVTVSVWLGLHGKKRSETTNHEEDMSILDNVVGEQLKDDSALQQTEQSNMREDNMVQDKTETQTVLGIREEPSVQKIDIGMGILATIFFITTILFFSIFLKHQQNRKKKVSKS